MLELIYARIGKPSEQVVGQQEHLKTVEELHAEHEEPIASLASQHQQEMAEQARRQESRLAEVMDSHQQALTALTEQHERRLGQLELQQQQHLLAAIEETKSSAPTIDYEALTEAATRQVEARFEAAMRQRITITEANNEAENTRQIEAPTARREAKPAASRGGSEARTNVLTLRQRGAEPSVKRAAVYTLLDTDDRLSSYEIAERTGYPPSTIQRYMKDWKVRQAEAESGAAHKAAESAM